MSKVESGRLHLQHLHIERLRLIESLTLDDLQQVNVFCGANGSGKTSILEAIYLLATGRSFRTHLLKPMIAHQQKDLLVFAQGQHFRFGMQRPLHADPILKLNGEVITQQSEFARLLPVQVIDPEGLSVLDSGNCSTGSCSMWNPNFIRSGCAINGRSNSVTHYSKCRV